MLMRRLGDTWILAINFVIAALFFATSKVLMPIWVSVALCAALLAAPLVALLQKRKGVVPSWNVLLALSGTALFWIPIFLTGYQYVGPAPGLVETAADVSIWVGVSLFFASALWPAPNA